MNTSQQTGPPSVPSAGPSSSSSSLPSQQVPERVADYSVGSNAYYQRACFTEYLNELNEQSQSERESRLGSIATRIKSGYRQLPNPKQILEMIRFNFQRQMHFKFWLRMNNKWPFTGTVEEMDVWHEVDELSTQLYEQVYQFDQEQQNKLKQQQVDQENSCLNESNGRGESGGSSVVPIGQQNEQAEQQVNPDVKPKAHVRTSSPFRMSLRPRSSIKSSITPRISTTRKSSSISTFKSSIAAPKPSSTSESGRKSERIQNRSIAITAPSTPAQASTSSKPSITPTPLYSKIGINKYRCHFGECTVVMGMLCNMKRHLRTHPGSKPYRCLVTGCIGFAANDRLGVRKHIQSKHYPGTVKDLQFLNQFIETNEELLMVASST